MKNIFYIVLFHIAIVFAQTREYPIEIRTITDSIRTATEKKDWNAVISLWEKVLQKYPEDRIPYSPIGNGLFTGHYNLAEIYAKRFNKLDSGFIHKAYIVKNLPNRYFGRYERSNPGDIKAIVNWVLLLRELGLSDTQQLEYLSELRRECASPNAIAAVDIESAAILYKLSKIDEAEDLLLNIIAGPPLIWYWFKSTGDFRWSAISSLSYLGRKYCGKEYVINRLSSIDLIEPQLQYIKSFSFGEIYLDVGDTLSAKNSFQLCSRISIDSVRADYPFSFLPFYGPKEEFQYYITVNQRLMELK